VLGALVMRGGMIAVGATLLEAFGWMTYVFGGLLLLTAMRMMVVHHDNLEPDRGLAVRMLARLMPVTSELHGEKFFVVRDGVRYATPLFTVLLMVESTDLLFAVDSIPAVFAVTEDPFIVYTSNVFAILGLRSLYFALAPLLQYFRYLRPSLVLILAFVGVKMLLGHQVHIPISASLAVIGGILVTGVLASVVVPIEPSPPLRSPVEGEMKRLLRLSRRIAERTVALVVGGTIVAFGTLALVIPGLGTLIITLGLSVLATQYMWAKRFLAKARHK
jgi:tellurite resistance protein TerC